MGGDLTLYIPGDPIPGYLASPRDGSPWPGVVVLHQAYGLDDDIRRITDRIADLGYLAIAPDLLAGGGWRCLARLFLDVRRGGGESVEKVEAVAEWLRLRADCAGPVGAIGFCLGGGYAFLLGAAGRIQATAPNYGLVPRNLSGSCPVIASFGGRDRVFRSQADRAKRALQAAAVDYEIKLYENAGHGFMNRTEGHALVESLGRPLLAVGYQREAAEDTWQRIEAFFARHLSVEKQPPPG